MSASAPTPASRPSLRTRPSLPVELQRRDTEIALAVFRTIFLLIVLTSRQFLLAHGRVATMLEIALIAAAGYNLALFIVHLRGAAFPRSVIIIVDVLLISFWLYFAGANAPFYFGLYYTVVIVAGLWFGVLGAFLGSLLSAALYLWAMVSSGTLDFTDRALLGAAAVQILFLMITAGVVSVATEVQAQERQALATSRAALQQHWQRIRIAQTIDQMIRPPRLPQIPGLEIAFRYRPAAYSVSGEYYDVIRLGPRQAGICIADFAVRWEWGLQYLYAFKNSFRLAARRETSPAAVLTAVNREMEAEIASDPAFRERPYAFASMCYAVVDLDQGLLTYSNAGNEPPFLLQAEGGLVSLEEAAGIVLNVTPDAVYEEAVVPIHTGDALVLFTDGLTEVRDEEGRFFGREGLVECAQEHWPVSSASALADLLFTCANEFGRRGQRRDDMTLLVARVAATDVGVPAPEERP